MACSVCAPEVAAWVRRVTRFVVTGGTGFVVDAGALLVLNRFLGPIWAQVLAYLIAMVVTFVLNRFWTFRAGMGRWTGQGARYAVVTVTGAVVTNGVYAAAVFGGLQPIIALAAGALGWAILSYGLMLRWVFHPHRDVRKDWG
jgi:putative flippase GtrA